MCPPYHQDGRVYRCGKTLGEQDPETNGCPGGVAVCDECMEVVCGFLDDAYNARARRKEWES
jgi:hypothetical protein